MDSYIFIVITSLVSLSVLLLSPPDKFYKICAPWYKKFTWRAWLTISMNLIVMFLTLLKQSSDQKESDRKQRQINRIERANSSMRAQLELFNLQYDSNSEKIFRKLDSSSQKRPIPSKQRPVLDLCNRGIQVDLINDSTISVDIPYCAITQEDAYNVDLQDIVLLHNNGKYLILSTTSTKFPKNIAISRETGKAIQYDLHPVNKSMLDSIYFFVKGSYMNNDNSLTFKVSDIFKHSPTTSKWVRLVGIEDANVRRYLLSKKLL